MIAALCMVALLAASALAIDLANARQQRRQAQGSADAAALAAAQDLPVQSDVVATVKAYALENWATPVSAWVGCTDGGRLAVLPDIANTNQCISMDAAGSQVRVRLPQVPVDTLFAGAIGIDSLPVSASATAEAQMTRSDRVLPATIAASDGTGRQCIENSGNNTSCSNRNSGEFGSFDSPRMNLFVTSSEKNAMVINFAMGVDHALTAWVSGSKVCDGTLKSPCTAVNSTTAAGDANHLDPHTGNATNEPGQGLVTGATINTSDGNLTFCGRLQRPDQTDDNLHETAPEGCNHWAGSSTSGPSVTVMGKKINGRHIAYWMKDEYRDVFYPGVNRLAQSTTSNQWAAGDAKLDCFLSTYRYDYGGAHSKGHPKGTEFWIDPSTIPSGSTTGDGTELTVAQARAYLTNTCGLPASFADEKVGTSDTVWPMFDKGMAGDARFGVLPAIHLWQNGNCCALRVVRFWATFIYGLHTNGGGNKLHATDAWVFEPALIETESGTPQLEFTSGGIPQVRLVE